MNGIILLTGGSGMVGRNLVEAASKNNIRIDAPSSSDLNLHDLASALAYLRRTRPEMVIHAAGYVGGIQANMREPARFLVDNWVMGSNILLASRVAEIPRVLNLGSSCMYPRDRSEAMQEEEILSGPLEPTNEGYAIAKCAVARLSEYLKRETPACDYKTIIPPNLYGPYDKFDEGRSHLVAAVVHKLHKAKVKGSCKVEIWGDGTARREFMFVGDLVDALVRAIQYYDTLPDVMNVGLGYDFTVNEYYSIIAEVIGYEGQFEHDLSKPARMARKLLNVSKAHAWGWRAKTSFQDGVAETYQYYLTSGAGIGLSTR